MLPDLRLLLASILVTFALVTAGIGMVAMLRVAQHQTAVAQLPPPPQIASRPLFPAADDDVHIDEPSGSERPAPEPSQPDSHTMTPGDSVETAQATPQGETTGSVAAPDAELVPSATDPGAAASLRPPQDDTAPTDPTRDSIASVSQPVSVQDTSPEAEPSPAPPQVQPADDIVVVAALVEEPALGHEAGEAAPPTASGSTDNATAMQPLAPQTGDVSPAIPAAAGPDASQSDIASARDAGAQIAAAAPSPPVTTAAEPSAVESHVALLSPVASTPPAAVKPGSVMLPRPRPAHLGPKTSEKPSRTGQTETRATGQRPAQP